MIRGSAVGIDWISRGNPRGNIVAILLGSAAASASPCDGEKCTTRLRLVAAAWMVDWTQVCYFILLVHCDDLF